MEIRCDTTIKVTLSSREQKLASEHGLMDISLIGNGDTASPETDKLWRLCNRSRLSLGDLVDGLTFSANSEQLGLLGWLQEEVRSQCALVQQGLSPGGCP